MRLFAYNDAKNYGRALCHYFSLLGHEANLFTSAGEVPEGEDVVCFIRMLHYPLSVRTYNKQVMEELNKKNVLLIPNIKEIRLHDDKVKQYKTFGDWMPKTWFTEDYYKALALVREVTYPLVSKAAEGASACNVRLIKNDKEALQEIVQIFLRENGIPLYLKNHYQKNYILWQEYLHQPKGNDWRVTLIAKKYATGFERFVRDPDKPFASGSGKRRIFTNVDKQVASLFDLGYKFATEFDLSMACIDVVYDSNGKPFILENSSAWGMYAYPECVWFEKTSAGWIPTEYVGDKQWQLIAKAISDREFHK